MTREELLMEVAKLRLRLRMNNRLRLELQALLSKLFRDHGVPIGDELLASLVVAVPEELLIEAETAPVSGKSKTPPPKPPTHHKPPPKLPPKQAAVPRRAKTPPPKPPTHG
jgi:hypothetical protein